MHGLQDSLRGRDVPGVGGDHDYSPDRVLESECVANISFCREI